MDQQTYHDMHLLNEVTQSPDVTQRDLSKRIGMALGLTNLLLRRLATKGYIKIVNVQKSRLRYLITPQGVMEKARLTREYLEYSLFFYRSVRVFLRERLGRLAREGQSRILLCGTGELAEIAYLSIRETGLELVGIIEESPHCDHFLGHPVHDLTAIGRSAFDCVLIAVLQGQDELPAKLLTLGASPDQLLVIPQANVKPLTVLAGATRDQDAEGPVSIEEAAHEVAAP